MRILQVEDDPEFGQALHRALEARGLSVDWIRNGLLAAGALADGDYACMLLDLYLPGRDGLSILREARERGDLTPVLVMSQLDSVPIRILALDTGADDCVVKPFDPGELMARMRALIRRRDGSAHSLIGAPSLRLDLTTREVLLDDRRQHLSAREFALLHALLERPGAVLSRQQLEGRIYGWGEEVSSNAVDVLIHEVRRKLGAQAIRNVRGLGWRVAAA